jgi:hypothetical protein
MDYVHATQNANVGLPMNKSLNFSCQNMSTIYNKVYKIEMSQFIQHTVATSKSRFFNIHG